MTSIGALGELWRSALAAVDPEACVADFFRAPRIGLRRYRRCGLFACGKAALGMAHGAPSALFDERLIVVPLGTKVPKAWRQAVRFASHPEPGRESVSAARAALSFFESFGREDAVVALISGGTSSLLCLPPAGLTLSAKRERIRRAMRAGWPIERLNRLRISLSSIKGGKLAEATEAFVTTLILSDVAHGDAGIVGSGPTVSARKQRDRAILLADNRTGLAAAARLARRTGGRVHLERKTVSGEARRAGSEFARRLRMLASRYRGVVFLLAGGETTVTLPHPGGRGGRNQELALAAALEIEGEGRLSILAAGSDGIDGCSENAGAFVDGATIARARRRGADASAFLARHDSASFFEIAGGAFRPGPTGTNVADWIFGYAEPE